MKRIVGHPNSTSIFSAVLRGIIKDDIHHSLPTEKFIALTTDGASVMTSKRGELFGKMKEKLNAKILSTHYIPSSPSYSFIEVESKSSSR